MPETVKMIIKTVLALTLALPLFFSPSNSMAENPAQENPAPENIETYKNLKVFADVIDEIQNNYVDPTSGGKLVEKAIKGMVRSLDPHSTFLSAEEYSSLQDDTKGEFSGIGIVLTMKNNMLTVISPIDDTPAKKAGIIAGDVIIKVNDKSTQDMGISEVVNKIKGPKGTFLTITIIRKGTPDPITVKLQRADIPLQSVKSARLENGYIYAGITNFNDHTESDLIKALSSYDSPKPEKDTRAGIKGLILDLRGNPGGLLQQAVKVTDLFIRDGVIVSIQGRHESQNQIWYATDTPGDKEYPIVVLINGGSASASEIVAGALQDHDRALILGTTSFGKGSVQNVKPLPGGRALKLTVARYYTPNGRSIQALGIEPDIQLAYVKNEPEAKAVKNKQVLKEKDLKNHLEATGLKSKKLSDTQEILLNDNQIKHALELLISHNLFKNAK